MEMGLYNGRVWGVDRHMGMSSLEAADLLVPLLSLIPLLCDFRQDPHLL